MQNRVYRCRVRRVPHRAGGNRRDAATATERDLLHRFQVHQRAVVVEDGAELGVAGLG